MKLTSVSAAIAMTAAVLFSYYFGITAAAAAVCIIVPAIIISSFIMHKPFAATLILGAAYFIALLSYAWSTGNHAHPTLNYTDYDVTLSGIIISNPQESRSSDNYKYILRINSIASTDNLMSAKDTILLTTPQRLSCGDKVTVNGTLKTFPKKMNENGFDTALYYKSKNIYARIFSEVPDHTGCGFTVSPYFISQLVYSKIDAIIYKYYYGDTAALISAVLTGNMHDFSDEYYTVLNNTALKRQLHPAYLHIWILISIIGLLRKIVHSRYRNIASVITLGIYAVISCSNIRFTRCIATAALMIFYREKDGSADYTEALAKIFIFCVLAMPMMIFNVTFVLSAISGLMVVMFTPLITKRLTAVPRMIRHTAAVMIVCALFLAPLGSVYFDGLCIYGFVTPFITMPLVLILLIMSPFVFLMLGIFGTAPVTGSYYDLILWIILKLPWLIDKLPLAHILMPKPTPAALLLIISIIFFAYYYMKQRIRTANAFRFAVLGLMLSLSLSMLTRIGSTDITFVNVGQGDGAVIHTAYGATVIIDGGGGNSYSDYDSGESVFVPYLISKGYCDIDAAFVSHFHKDHVQGILAAIRNLRVRNVFYMPPRPDEKEPTFWYNELKAAAEDNGTKLCPFTDDTQIKFDNGLTFKVYLPGKSLILSGDENNSSLLIKAEYGRSAVMFTGDMSARAEREFISCGTDVDADVLKVAHHGSKTAASNEWTEAVSPNFAVISCGEDNKYGHPSPETLNTLRAVRIVRTDLNGDIRVTIDKNGIKRVSTFR